MRDIIANFPLLSMVLGALGATLGLYLYDKYNFDEVLKKGAGLFLVIIMTSLCFTGAAYAMTEVMLENSEAYFKAVTEEENEHSIQNDLNKATLKEFREPEN